MGKRSTSNVLKQHFSLTAIRARLDQLAGEARAQGLEIAAHLMDVASLDIDDEIARRRRLHSLMRPARGNGQNSTLRLSAMADIHGHAAYGTKDG